MKNIFLIIFFFQSFWVFSQKKNSDHLKSNDSLVNDTLKYVEFEEIKVYPNKTFISEKEKRKFDRLVMHVKRVYPLAKICEMKYLELQKLVEGKSDKEKRRLMKQAEEEIKDQYYDEITQLTFTQGRILLKLIDRQTKQTSYNLLKDYRGSFRAVFWQSVARIFGANLKSEYHPESNIEDRNIEEIINLIECGVL